MDLKNSCIVYAFIKSVYENCGLFIHSFQAEAESKAYQAAYFNLNKLNIRFRVAKITPTKVGQFVTLWKRSDKGITVPYDSKDLFDFFVILTQKNDKKGVFVFPKSALKIQGVLSIDGVGGKRGIRVYPSWDIPINNQAVKTQKWQSHFFIEIPKNTDFNCDKFRELHK